MRLHVAAYVKREHALKTGTDRVTRLPDGSDFRSLVGPNLDGSKIKRIVETGGHDGVLQIKPDGQIGDLVAYRPEQIKSATGNRGTFDPNNPDIRYSKSDKGNTQAQIHAVIEAARQPGHAPQKAVLGKVSDWLASEAAKHGLNLQGYQHTLDGSAVRHMFNRHSNPKIEQSRGQIALNDTDIQNVPEVIAQADAVVLGTQTKGHKDQIGFIKSMPNGTVLYLEEVRTGKGELSAVSIRKYPATRDFSAIVHNTLPSNARSDSGDGVIVLTPPDTAQSPAAAHVQKVADSISRAWGNAPEIVVVDNMQDTRLPEAVRIEDASQKSGGANGEPEGFYWKGKAYVVASQAKTDADIARFIAHEVLGHHGLRGKFGAELDGILDRLALLRTSEVYARPDGARTSCRPATAGSARTRRWK